MKWWQEAGLELWYHGEWRHYFDTWLDYHRPARLPARTSFTSPGQPTGPEGNGVPHGGVPTGLKDTTSTPGPAGRRGGASPRKSCATA
ncbi:MAG: hypothetical protein U0531_17610 [Dehalococcoidia bacterium]